MTATNQQMTREQVADLSTLAAQLQAKAEANDDRDTAVMAYAVQRACSELEESRREFTAADATIHNLELKVAQVVAENAALKESEREFNEYCRQECENAGDTWVDDFTETPETDTALDEVRAQGVEMAIEHIEQTICPNHETILREFAAQLRQGAEQ